MHVRIGAVGGVAYGGQGGVADGQQLRHRARGPGEPEVFAVPIPVADEHIGPQAALHAVDDVLVILGLHQHLVDAQDEVGAVLGGDAVEVFIGGRIAAVHQLAADVLLGVFQIAHPGAFHHLVGLRHHLGPRGGGILLDAQAVLQGEAEVLHLLRRSVSGPALGHDPLVIAAPVGHEVQGDGLAAGQQMLGGVGGVAGLQHHGVVALAGDVIGEAQGVGADRGAAVLRQGGDHDGGHGEVGAGLIEVVDDAKVFEAAHEHSSLSVLCITHDLDAFLRA